MWGVLFYPVSLKGRTRTDKLRLKERYAWKSMWPCRAGIRCGAAPVNGLFATHSASNCSNYAMDLNRNENN